MRFLLISFCFLMTVVAADTTSGGTWIIDKDSRLFIYGSTNINNFTCTVKNYDRADTLAYREDNRLHQLVFEKSKMLVTVKDFDCGNALITKDFKETLKSEKYPDLEIRFLTLEQAAMGQPITGQVMITLAGVSRRFRIQYTLDDMTDTKLQLSGKRKVKFSDFSLQAPEKMMGLIKVQETIEVEFRIILRPIQ